jgi:hypothetical protein
VQSRPVRVVLVFVITLLCCAVIFCIGGYGLDWYRVHRSKQFVERLRQFHVSQTTEQEVEKFVSRFGGTYSPPQPATQDSSAQPAHYFSAITSPYVTLRDSPYTLPGLRVWTVYAFLTVESGRLSNVYASQYVLRSGRFGLGTSIELTKSRELGSLLDFGPYYVYEAHITGPAGERFGVRLSPEATPDERRKAFDFNFSCLTQLRECRHVCEMMPSAWRDLSPDRRLRYEDGREVVSDSECRERMK